MVSWFGEITSRDMTTSRLLEKPLAREQRHANDLTALIEEPDH